MYTLFLTYLDCFLIIYLDNQNVNTSSLLDLGFDAPQPTPPSAQANNTCSETSFLDEQFKLLGMEVTKISETVTTIIFKNSRLIIF